MNEKASNQTLTKFISLVSFSFEYKRFEKRNFETS